MTFGKSLMLPSLPHLGLIFFFDAPFFFNIKTMEMVSFPSIWFGREGPKSFGKKTSPLNPTTPGAPPPRLHLAWSDGVSSAKLQIDQLDRVPPMGSFAVSQLAN